MAGDDDIIRWLEDYPAHRPLPPDGVFELGLCMAGAVSAGAYTAGVLDVLIEALDAFAAERATRPRDGAGALHEVRVPVLGGASAGGMCAAIAAIFLDKAFPPVRPETPAAERDRNPLWRAWVSQVDIAGLLDRKDVTPGQPLASLLDCTLLERIVDDLLDARPALPAAHRPWLATPLRAVLTLANLRGVPYALRFDGSGFRHWMALHADHVRYAIDLDDVAGATPGDSRKVGESPLDRGAPRSSAPREAFKAVALGTGAFPVALSARVLTRESADYLFRAALTPASPLAEAALPEPVPDWVGVLRPAWDAAPSPYDALCVDGGAMNNEPLDLVRRVLAGWGGRNPKAAKDAARAVLLIDPFVNPGQPGPDKPQGLIGSIMPLFNALVANSRFKPEDLALAADRSIGSRFLVAPSRGKGWEAEGAIAAGHLGGFLGFFSRAYREHDYFLGRRNALNFLRWVFLLPETNPLFADRWTEADRARWGVDAEDLGLNDGLRRLPVIPLCGDLETRKEDLPRWPARAFSAAAIRPAIDARTKVALPALRDTLVGQALGKGGFWPWLARTAVWAVTPLLRPRVVDAAQDRIAEAVAALDAAQHRIEPGADVTPAEARQARRAKDPAASQGPPR